MIPFFSSGFWPSPLSSWSPSSISSCSSSWLRGVLMITPTIIVRSSSSSLPSAASFLVAIAGLRPHEAAPAMSELILVAHHPRTTEGRMYVVVPFAEVFAVVFAAGFSRSLRFRLLWVCGNWQGHITTRGSSILGDFWGGGLHGAVARRALCPRVYEALAAMATVCDHLVAGVGDSDSASASAFRLGAIDMLGVLSVM
jgi:hypothetical protein